MRKSTANESQDFTFIIALEGHVQGNTIAEHVLLRTDSVAIAANQMVQTVQLLEVAALFHGSWGDTTCSYLIFHVQWCAIIV